MRFTQSTITKNRTGRAKTLCTEDTGNVAFAFDRMESGAIISVQQDFTGDNEKRVFYRLYLNNDQTKELFELIKRNI